MTRFPRSFGILLAISLPALGFPPGSEGQQDARDLRIRQVWSTNGLHEEIGPFGFIGGMVQAGGAVWVSDQMGAQIIAVSMDGTPSQVIAREGQGPGEVRGPSYMARTPAGEIAVYDVGAGRIHLFDPSGDFRRSVRLPSQVAWPKGFAVLPEGEFVLSGVVPGTRKALHRFAADGLLIESWEPARPTESVRASWVVSGGALSVTDDGHLLYSQAAPHAIRAFPIESNDYLAGSDHTIASDENLLVPIDDGAIIERVEDGRQIRSFRGGFPQSRGIFQLDGGALLNVVVDAEGGSSLWEVYASDGTLRAREEVDRAYRPWGLTAAGHVLASYNDPDTAEPMAALLDVDLGPTKPERSR